MSGETKPDTGLRTVLPSDFESDVESDEKSDLESGLPSDLESDEESDEKSDLETGLPSDLESDEESDLESGLEAGRALALLEALQDEPDTTQAALAARAGIAVGTVNWYLKRFGAKGYVKVKRIGRWRWRYLLTPRGASAKARLAASYVETSMALYRRTRDQATELLRQIRLEGHHRVFIEGDGDLAEVVALTCLEQGVTVAENQRPSAAVPVIRVHGTALSLVAGAAGDAGGPHRAASGDDAGDRRSRADDDRGSHRAASGGDAGTRRTGADDNRGSRRADDGAADEEVPS